jgi:hypothetical protein
LLGAVRARDESTKAVWWSGGSNPSPVKTLPSYSLTAAERRHLIRPGLAPTVKERLQTVLGIRMEGSPEESSWKRRSKGTIVEIATCGTNHLTCMHEDCPVREWSEAQLYDKSFFGKSLARILAEDAFRLATLQLDYEVKVVWVCGFQDLVRERESSAAAFSQAFVMAPSKFPLNASLTQDQVITYLPPCLPRHTFFFDPDHCWDRCWFH